MNKLFCVMGFLLCFSSFCMNNENTIDIAKQREAIEIVRSAMRENRFDDVYGFLKESFSNKVLSADTIFEIDWKHHTLLPYYLSKVKSIEGNIRAVDPASRVGFFLLYEAKDQLIDSNRYTESCYIQKNDSRIIDLAISAIDGTSCMFVSSFLNIVFLWDT